MTEVQKFNLIAKVNADNAKQISYRPSLPNPSFVKYGQGGGPLVFEVGYHPRKKKSHN